MRISDWSSDVCSSDLQCGNDHACGRRIDQPHRADLPVADQQPAETARDQEEGDDAVDAGGDLPAQRPERIDEHHLHAVEQDRSEEHTSELQSLMRISYAVFCLKKKKTNRTHKYKNSNKLPRHRKNKL